MHEDGDVLGQDDGFLVDWCLSQESSEEAGPAVASSNESIPSPHHRVRAGPEERSSTFPCLITPHLSNASFHSTRHGRVRPLDLGLIRNPFARELLAWWRDVRRRLCTDEAHTRAGGPGMARVRRRTAGAATPARPTPRSAGHGRLASGVSYGSSGVSSLGTALGRRGSMMSFTASGVWRIASLRRLIKEKLPTEFILQEVATYRRTGAAPVLISERQYSIRAATTCS